MCFLDWNQSIFEACSKLFMLHIIELKWSKCLIWPQLADFKTNFTYDLRFFILVNKSQMFFHACWTQELSFNSRGLYPGYMSRMTKWLWIEYMRNMTGRNSTWQTSMNFLQFPTFLRICVGVVCLFLVNAQGAWVLWTESVKTLYASSIPIYYHCKDFGGHEFHMA